MKFSNDKMKDGANEEGFMNEDVDSPPEGASVTKEAKNTDESCEEGCINGDRDSPKKVCCRVDNQF